MGHLMTTYFSEPQSMYYRFGEDQDQVLKVLAERYIGANAQADFVYRVFQKSGILQNEKGLYDLNLGERFPDAPKGQVSYAAALSGGTKTGIWTCWSAVMGLFVSILTGNWYIALPSWMRLVQTQW